jgi:hypothetical protein
MTHETALEYVKKYGDTHHIRVAQTAKEYSGYIYCVPCQVSIAARSVNIMDHIGESSDGVCSGGGTKGEKHMAKLREYLKKRKRLDEWQNLVKTHEMPGMACFSCSLYACHTLLLRVESVINRYTAYDRCFVPFHVSHGLCFHCKACGFNVMSIFCSPSASHHRLWCLMVAGDSTVSEEENAWRLDALEHLQLSGVPLNRLEHLKHIINSRDGQFGYVLREY